MGFGSAILLSGVHATIGAVVAAFTIPTSKRIGTRLFLRKVRLLSVQIMRQTRFITSRDATSEDKMISTMEKFSALTEDAILAPASEHALHNFVSSFVLPVFAFANAGVKIEGNVLEIFSVARGFGVILGLVLGKVVGVVLFTKMMLLAQDIRAPGWCKWEAYLRSGIIGRHWFYDVFVHHGARL
ncbi:MAG: Na+/H+ antiporter NhaA [Owenweeksia sp.]|nr:Na+/H+ antiporter NhaA [Owenweeksia sp.]